MYACLAVTCHLHFWQNDRDFLRATVVTRGWNGYRNKSQHRKSTLENKILPPFQQGFEPATFQSRVRCSNHWAIPAPISYDHFSPFLYFILQKSSTLFQTLFPQAIKYSVSSKSRLFPWKLSNHQIVPLMTGEEGAMIRVWCQYSYECNLISFDSSRYISSSINIT